MSLAQLFKNIDTAPSSSKHRRYGWLNIKCPYCNKGGDHYHLGFHIKRQYFNCWSCGKKPLFKTLKVLTGLPYSEMKEMLKTANKGNLNGISKQQYKDPKVPFKFPPKTKQITKLKHHKEYLKKRGFKPEYLMKKYKIKGTSIISKLDNLDLSWRIVIPIYQNGEAVTWQTRAIGKKGLPYIACPKERERINIKNLIYPEETSHTLFLVEGLFDCWKVRLAGFPAICGFGVGLNSQQIRILSKRRLIIFYDGDNAGRIEAQKIKERIEFIKGKEVQIAKCPEGKDPGDLTVKQINQILKEY